MIYQTIHTPTPPVLALEDGRLVLKVTHGELTIVADLGDGRYFFSQIVEKLIDPALLAHAQAVAFNAPND